ncbi:MAG: DUF1326 domain-containing protein [Acidobacteriota bacterium]|nr:DUF1326 domain-containing protein [Acidobacteriota bacterium]
MAWKLTGELVESCSCNLLCPCWYGVRDLMIMDRGWCATPWLLRFASGEADGASLPAFNAVIAAFFPGPTLLDGNGTARVYFDNATAEEQRATLEPILKGQRGGATEILAGLVSTWLPTSVTSITVEENDGTVTADIGEVGHINSTRLVNDLGDRMTMTNAGFAVGLQLADATAELAPSDGTRWTDPDLPEAFDCKSGAVGQFSWSG